MHLNKGQTYYFKCNVQWVSFKKGWNINEIMKYWYTIIIKYILPDNISLRYLLPNHRTGIT